MTPALPYILNLKIEENIMAKASKAFNKIGSGTPSFKPEFKKPNYQKQDTGFYKPKEGFNNTKKPFNKPNKGEFKPRQKQNPQHGISIDKRLHTLFMSTKDYTLLFKVFSTTGGDDLPVFNKLIVKNIKNDRGENVFSYYLYDANHSKKIEKWNADLEITDVIFYSDTNVKFILNSGATVICEQIISKKYIDAKFQEFVMGKKPIVKG